MIFIPGLKDLLQILLQEHPHNFSRDSRMLWPGKDRVEVGERQDRRPRHGPTDEG